MRSPPTPTSPADPICHQTSAEQPDLSTVSLSLPLWKCRKPLPGPPAACLAHPSGLSALRVTLKFPGQAGSRRGWGKCPGFIRVHLTVSQQAPRCQHPRDLGFNRLLRWTPRRPLVSAHNKPHSFHSSGPRDLPRGDPGSAGPARGSSRLSAVGSAETRAVGQGSPAWLLPGLRTPPGLPDSVAKGGSASLSFHRDPRSKKEQAPLS